MPGQIILRAKGGRRQRNPGEMNRLEAAYAEYLEGLKLAGEIADYRFEAVKFRLAKRTWFTPDFLVMLADGTVECVEVKGHWEDDARVKIKVAAETFWWFRFRAVQAIPKRNGGGFTIKEIE